MAGAFHGVTEADAIINVGVSGPGVVKTRTWKKCVVRILKYLCETIKKTAFKVTRVGQLGCTGSKPQNVGYSVWYHRSFT